MLTEGKGTGEFGRDGHARLGRLDGMEGRWWDWDGVYVGCPNAISHISFHPVPN